jgi:hypothetical protein
MGAAETKQNETIMIIGTFLGRPPNSERQARIPRTLLSFD